MTRPVIEDVDARFALRAPEPLAAANRAGYLRAADVHVATRLAALAGEDDPDVLLAVALLVRVVRDGSTCLDLAGVEDLAPEVLDDGQRARERKDVDRDSPERENAVHED